MRRKFHLHRTLSSVLLTNVFLLWFLVCFCFAEYSEGMEAYRKAWDAYATQRFEESKTWVQRALRADPENAAACALDGDLAYLRHDLPAAKNGWSRALRLNPQLLPLQNQIAQADVELELEKNLQSVKVGSLIVRVPSDLSKEAVEQISRDLSQGIAILKPFFDYEPERPLTVLIYRKDDFYSTTHMPTEVLGLFDGKIRLPEGSEVSVLWHEYTHAIVYDLSHGRAPRWLQEGLAQGAERMAGSATAHFQSLTLDSAPRLKALFGIANRPDEAVVMPVGQFYEASYELVHYLLDVGGWDRMRSFLRALGNQQSVEEAIQAIYGWDLNMLEKKWKASLRSPSTSSG